VGAPLGNPCSCEQEQFVGAEIQRGGRVAGMVPEARPPRVWKSGRTVSRVMSTLFSRFSWPGDCAMAIRRRVGPSFIYAARLPAG